MLTLTYSKDRVIIFFSLFSFNEEYYFLPIGSRINRPDNESIGTGSSGRTLFRHRDEKPINSTHVSLRYHYAVQLKGEIKVHL